MGSIKTSSLGWLVLAALVTTGRPAAAQEPEAAGSPSPVSGRGLDELLTEWLNARDRPTERQTRWGAYRQAFLAATPIPRLEQIDLSDFAAFAPEQLPPIDAKRCAQLLDQWSQHRHLGASPSLILPWLLRIERGGQFDLRVCWALVEAWGSESANANAKHAAAACAGFEVALRSAIVASEQAKSPDAAVVDLGAWLPVLASHDGALEGAKWLLGVLGRYRARFEDGKTIAQDQLTIDRVEELVPELRAAVEAGKRRDVEAATRRIAAACPAKHVVHAERTANLVQAVAKYDAAWRRWDADVEELAKLDKRIAPKQDELKELQKKRDQAFEKEEAYRAKKDRDGTENAKLSFYSFQKTRKDLDDKIKRRKKDLEPLTEARDALAAAVERRPSLDLR